MSHGSAYTISLYRWREKWRFGEKVEEESVAGFYG